jgi:hypothetical protein
MQAWRVDRESKGGSNVCGHMKAGWWAPMHDASRLSGVKPSYITVLNPLQLLCGIMSGLWSGHHFLTVWGSMFGCQWCEVSKEFGVL